MSEGWEGHLIGPSILVRRATCVEQDLSPSQHDSVSGVYFDKIGMVRKTSVYVLLTSLCVWTEVSGLAAAIDDMQTILVTPEAVVVVAWRRGEICE